MKRWSPDPNVRAGPADYPIDVSGADIVPLMYNGVGGSTVLYAGDWPRLTPSDFRVRSLDGVADDWPLTLRGARAVLRPHRAPRRRGGLRRRPGLPAGRRPAAPAAAARPRRARRGARARPARLALVAGAERDPLGARTTAATPARSWGTCMQGCPEGAKCSSDVTDWPQAIARGARVITGARVTRLVLGADGLVTGAEYVDAEGRAARAEADVVVLAANAVGTARLLLLSRLRGVPRRAGQPLGLVGRRLMMHPFAVATGVFAAARSRPGAATSARASTRCSSTRPTSAAASCAAPSGAWRPRPAGR